MPFPTGTSLFSLLEVSHVLDVNIEEPGSRRINSLHYVSAGKFSVADIDAASNA